jgi:hypothetical protein
MVGRGAGDLQAGHRWRKLVTGLCLMAGGCSTGRKLPDGCPCHHIGGGNYQLSFIPASSGSCPSYWGSQPITLDPLGTLMGDINAPSFQCNSTGFYYDGCETTSNDCLQRDGPGNCSFSQVLDWACDGGSATGTRSLTCTFSDGGTCSSTYNVTAVSSP